MRSYYKLLVLIIIIVFASGSESVRKKYFEILEYYSLQQLLVKHGALGAIRFFFNPGGDDANGDVCITIFREDGLFSQITIQSGKNLWNCLSSKNKLNLGIECTDGMKIFNDTLVAFNELYEKVVQKICDNKNSKHVSKIFDGKFCIVEFATKEKYKKVDLIPIDFQNNDIYKIGALLFLINNWERREVSQKWIQDLVNLKGGSFNKSDLRKLLNSILLQ